MAVIRPQHANDAVQAKQADRTENAVDTSTDTVKPDEKKVVIEGPLSEIYTKALDAIYANKKSKIKVMLLDVGNEDASKLFVVDDDSLPSVANDLTKRASTGDNFDVLLVPSNTISPIRSAMESLLRDKGIKVYRSLDQWMEVV